MKLTRRIFLKGGAMAVVGTAAIPSFLTRAVYASEAAVTGKKRLVVIFQRGAADGLNIVVPHAEPSYYQMRPSINIPRQSVLDLDGFFGLHPSLASFKPLWEQKHLAIVHAALHLRWFLNMARRISRGGERRGQRAVPGSTAVPRPAAQSLSPSPARMPAAPSNAPWSVGAVVAASADDDRLVSRRSFLVALGTAVGATAFVGVGTLLRSDATSAAGTEFADAQNGVTDPSQAQSSNGWSGNQGNGWQGGGSTQNGGGSSGSTSAAQRVVVDEAACVGCGRCLDVCPNGVFAWSGGKAVARNPDACRLCGHCVQVCPANAITLSG